MSDAEMDLYSSDQERDSGRRSAAVEPKGSAADYPRRDEAALPRHRLGNDLEPPA